MERTIWQINLIWVITAAIQKARSRVSTAVFGSLNIGFSNPYLCSKCKQYGLLSFVTLGLRLLHVKCRLDLLTLFFLHIIFYQYLVMRAIES